MTSTVNYLIKRRISEEKKVGTNDKKRNSKDMTNVSGEEAKDIQ